VNRKVLNLDSSLVISVAVLMTKNGKKAGFHTEVGETGTPVGIVQMPRLSYSEPTNSSLSKSEGGTRSMHTDTLHIRRSSYAPVAMILFLSLGACSWVPKGDMQLDVGIKDRGVASWYGEQFHGKQAANGELFDMEALTAAHRTMPLGSVVRVVNLINGKHLYVRITDRGPYKEGRILDLSHGAAIRLGMEHHGLAYVQVEIVGERRPELILLSEQFSAHASSLLADTMTPSDRPAPGMTSPSRSLPADLWIARRNRWALSTLAVTPPTQIPVASLALN
jgi:rare lipoprotein A